MVAVVAFAIVLLLAVLLSERAERSVLSINGMFLLAGFLVGNAVLGLVAMQPANPVVAQLAELALFSVLFADGMRVGVRELTGAWRLPGRALLLGMPLTLVLIALLARWLIGLSWSESLLLAAILSPTDPVFAAAIVGREEVPRRLRRLLNVESGLNDGLALPIVLIMLNVVQQTYVDLWQLLGELALGVLVGVVVPWAAIRLENSWFFSAVARYRPLTAFAVGLLVLGLAELIHANLFLAAFAAGVTVATIGPGLRDAFHTFGEEVAELLKLAAIFVFGAVSSPDYFWNTGLGGYLFAILTIVLARPIAIELALLGSGISWRERVTAAWFGPKGFASVVYALLIWEVGIPHGGDLLRLATIVIIASILAHSSTDVIVARWFQEVKAQEQQHQPS
jgi:NhaP-type Na+/H+ or K+/H+ antiporter